MSDQKVSITYQLDAGNVTSTLGKIRSSAERTESATKRATDALMKFGSVGIGISFVAGCFGKLYSAMQACEGAYNAQHTVETKLEQAMRNTMGATLEDVQAVKDLTAAQQKLGVVGDEVQLAGAQELATFVGQKKTLQDLIPVMNDMIAQQQGLNATQEGATSIASVLGKAMNGQTGILQRYGFTMTEAQAKILKFGTESQRAATLAEIVEAKVGGMNEALAQTPEGRMRQYSNDMGDLSERVGGIYMLLRQAMLPAMSVMADVLDGIIGFVEAHMDTITATITKTIETIQWVGSTLIDLMPIITGVAAAVGVLTLAANAMAIKAAIATTATNIWAAAQALLNAVMTANPIGLIIAAIAALVGAIVWVCKHTEGWGTLWDAVCTFAKESFYAYVEGVKLYFNTLVNGIMIGLDKIKLGWYKFKKACGIGSDEENTAAIRQINADVEARQKAIAEGAKKMLSHVNNARKAFDNVSIKWKADEESPEKSDTNSQIKAGASLNIGGRMTPVGLSGGSNVKGSTSAVASGGTRNTQITINFSKEMVKMEFSGGYLDNKETVERSLAESLLRVLSAAKASI